MASPQRENGFTGIANELLEQFSMPGMNGSELRVVLFITRKTYGYQKTSDKISLSQFQLGTGMNRAQAVETIRSLVEKKIVIKENGVYKLNKNYEEWVVCKRVPPQEVVCKSIQPSMQKHTKTSMQKHTHKRKKETYTKETSKNGSYDPLGAEIIKEFELVDPKNKKYYGNTTQRDACDFLIAEYGLETVLERVRILPTTNKLPHFPIITTPLQLRDKWVQLQDTAMRKKVELQTKHKIAFS